MQGSANCFWKGPDSKHFTVCRPYRLHWKLKPFSSVVATWKWSRTIYTSAGGYVPVNLALQKQVEGQIWGLGPSFASPLSQFSKYVLYIFFLNLNFWPWPEKPVPPALAVWSLNHWTARDAPVLSILIFTTALWGRCFPLTPRPAPAPLPRPSNPAYRILVPRLRIKPGPQQCKSRVLTPEPPGNSFVSHFTEEETEAQRNE